MRKNLFEDNEKVMIKETKEIVTVDYWSWVPSLRKFSYSIIEHPETLFWEYELDKCS